jgi:hypothetical protein
VAQDMLALEQIIIEQCWKAKPLVNLDCFGVFWQRIGDDDVTH